MNTNKSLKKGKLNKTRSMQFRILATIIFAMFSITFFIGGISIYEVDQYIQNESENFVVVACENEGAQIDNLFEDMEKSVTVMESYIMDFFTEEVLIEDQDFQENVINSVDKMFSDVAKHASGAVAYYFRFDPAISNSKMGLFYSKTKESNEYVSLEPTDISLYEKDDIEHVGWFWQPYEAGEPVWMSPYYNQNNNIYMISYVVPMYYEEKFIGIIGMDFDYTVLAERVHEIKIYENGFAHLQIDETVVCSYDSDCEQDTKDNSKYLRVSKELKNGMNLVLSASYDDIRQIRYEIGFEILFVVLVLSAFFTIIAIFVVRKIVAPLKKLADASIKLSNGDYNVEFVNSNVSEIELLNTAFENMATHLHEREKELRFSANRDSLTGLRNTTAYKRWVEEFDKDIEKKTAKFGIVVFDLNQLKQTNDNYGHDIGDKLIATAAKVISDVFKRSPVFRIGGDEFLAILRHRDLEDCEKLFVQLDLECAKARIEEKEEIPISIARGFAVFDLDKDLSFNDVFKRADYAMYENKRKNKKVTV
ncbi:MAG: diguanylate cyclase [Acutalibacteraceae bacterium]|nr:diguanylate cyclase [Acutalibacteraceae bacterium]